MPILTSLLDMVADPYTRRYMRDTIIAYRVPDCRHLYDAVVREIKWFGPLMSEGKYNALIDALETEFKDEDEADKIYDFLPVSYDDDFREVIRQINHEACPMRRIYASVRKSHYNNIRRHEWWVKFFTSEGYKKM